MAARPAAQFNLFPDCSLDLLGPLLHEARPFVHLAPEVDSLVREEAMAVVAVALTYRCSGQGAAVPPAPPVRHCRRAARAPDCVIELSERVIVRQMLL